jgi:pilin isopeptide linkage protein
MQTAVNNFIDSTLEANNAMAGDTKHQLSIVTYASNANTRANLQEVTAETAASLKNTVDSLEADGATNAGAGMTNANTELQSERARANAQEVVIFFTDGTPTTGNTFNATVANTAVKQAGEIKSEARGGLVYAIGIFDGANADSLESKENQFMNAVSSNYPNATAYNNRGDRVDAKYQYYKTASESDKLDKVFNEIFDEIKNPGSVPTEVVGGDPMNSGYITFEDELGAYMKVDGFKEIVFADKEFKRIEKTTSGNTDTYTFEGIVDASDLYPNGNLNEIVIKVEKADALAKGDKVTVQIPAALIPLRQVDVQETDAGSGEYTTTVSNTYPMRIFFGVSLKDDVAAMLENPDSDMKQHIADNTGNDGKVNFYSNDFTKAAAMGNTIASFTPADTNNFYYFGQDSVLYIDENCKTPATRENSGHNNIDTDKDYWYQRTYYEAEKKEPQTEHIKITGELAAELLQYAERNDTGQWYIPKEAPRLAAIHNTHLAKEDNVTGTAEDVINPQWGRNESQQVIDEVNVSLGNNGKLSLDVPGALEISKAVTAEEGLTAPDETFTFKVDLEAAQGTELKDSYAAQKLDKDGKESGEAFTVADNGIVKLKAGEKVQIYGLAKGMQYSVTEENLPAGFTQKTPADSKAETGTIGTDADANGMNQAAFTNTYAVEGYTMKSVDLGLKGTKTMKSDGDVRSFKEGDIFKFNIKASQQTPDAPLPTNATCIIKPTSGTSAAISFGDFTFVKPGEYRYSILEYLPNGETSDEWDKIIPGITYDPSEYRLIINVQDNHEGKLIPTNIEIDKRQDQTGAEDWKALYTSTGDLETGESAKLPGNDKSYIDFVNTWNAEEQSISLNGKKTLNGKSLGDYSVKEQFGFKLEAAGSRQIGSQDGFAEDTDQPMPTDDTGKYIYRNSTTGDITISGITFKTENIGKEYKYILRELQPTDNGKVDGNPIEGAKKNNAGNWVYKGITFDKEAKEIIIKVNSPDGTNEIQADNSFEFVNSYDAATTLALNGTKKITGLEFKSGDTFTFEITGANGAPLPKNAEGQEMSDVTIHPESGKEGALDFGTITFTQADMKGAVAEKNQDGSTKQYTKDFTYTLTETGTDGNGMTYDKAPKRVTITVTDDNHGTMKATVKEGRSEITWTNKYTATGAVGEADLTVTKVLNGRAMKAREFNFTIKSAEDTPQLTKNFANEFSADGSVQTLKDGFELAFDQNDIGETFTYIVDEVENTDANGITYDKSEYQVAFTPKDNGDGTITPGIKVTKVKNAAGETVSEDVALTDGKAVLPFVNTYSTAPAEVDLSETAGFTKAITGRDWKDGDSFKFNITGTAQDGDAPMPQKDNQGVTSVTVDYDMAKGQDKTAADAETKFGFGTITFDKAGVYTYQVTEDKAGTTENGLTYSDNTATVTITVEDKEGTGKLTATPVISSPKFVNTYKAVLDYTGKGNIAIFKTLHGTNVKDDQFSFKVKAKDEATEDRLKIPMDGITEETNPATEGQRTEVARLSQITFTEADAGKTYTFTVEEVNAGGEGFVYDDTVYEVEIAVTDLGEGKLQAVTTVRNTTDNENVSETTWTTDSAAGTTPIALDFTNVYRASDDVAIKVTKEVTGGRPLKEGEFTFKLTTKPNNGGTGTEVAAETNQADGTVDFGIFTYTTTGYQAPEGAVNLTDIISGDNAYATMTQVDGKNVYTVNYIASEVTDNLPAGMTASTLPFAVTVTVTDNGDGTLTAEASTGKFTNNYATLNDYILIGMNGTKTIDTNGVAGLTPPVLKDNFTFELKALDGAPAPTRATAKTDENGNVDFGTATFNSSLLEGVTAAEDGSRTKEFKYEVTEVKENLPGVTYDTEKKTFTVTLKDDGNGNLSATTSNADGQPLFAFKNSYGVEPKTSSITDTIQIQKVLEGRTLKEGEFTFQLTENVDGKDTVVATGTNDADGKVTFGSIEYTKPGNHTYTVREQIPEGAADGVYEGVTYDKAIYTINTEVTDKGDGTLEVTHAVKDDEEVTFTNTYEAKPTAVVIHASKKLVDKKLEDGQFTFELRDENDKLVGKAKKNNADGQVVFDEITYDKAGTYKYTVSEVNDKQDRILYDDKKYSVEVKVTDNGKGSYVAEVSYPDGAPSFVNTYEKPEEPAKPDKPDENKGDGNVVSAKTGDTAQTGAWLVLMIAAIVGIGAIVVIRRRERRHRR